MFQIKQLSYSYKLKNKNTSIILDNLSFSLPSKGLIFVKGKSGCGKTTLLNILEGLLIPTTGKVLYNNKDIYKDKKLDYIQEIGVLFQNFNLLDNLTVYQNLKIVTDLTNLDSKSIDDKLREFNLLEFKNQDVSTLSGGEKQRIAFIRAILSSPKVLFCDEPTGAIDEENASILMANLRELSKDILVVIVTHNSSLIKDSDYSITLNNGRIEESNLKNIEETVKFSPKPKRKRKNSYKRVLSNRLFKKSCFKHFLFVISLFFTFLFSFLTLGTTIGLKNQKDNLEFSYENYNEFQVSFREKRVETNSPLTLIKEVRPDINLVKEKFSQFKDFEIFNNYSYFLNGNNHIYSEKEELKNVKVALSYNLKTGAKINNSLFDLLDHKKSKLSLELNQNYVYNLNSEKSFNERFSYRDSISSYEIINEFKYLSVPTIYLPLFTFEQYLKETYLNITFTETKEKVNWFDVVSTSKNDDPISSYSYLVYFDDKVQSKEGFKFIDNLKEEDDLKITNDAHVFVTSFLDIAHILNIGLITFTIISILITLLLFAFITYSIYLEQKKDFSILMVLGLRRSDISDIFTKVLVTEIITTLTFSLTIYVLSSRLLDKLIYKNLAIKNLLFNNVCSLGLGQTFKIMAPILLVFLLFIFIPILIIEFIVFKLSRSNLSLTLREE